MRRKCFSLLLALMLAAATGYALDLVPVNQPGTQAVLYFNPADGTGAVFPDGVAGGQFLSTWTNVRDSLGHQLYDERYTFAQVLQLENGDTILPHQIDWMEWSTKLHLATTWPDGYNTIWLMTAYKLDQSTPVIGVEEATRTWTESIEDDYYPIYTSGFNISETPPGEFVHHTRPYYTNINGVTFMHWTPDSVIECGVNPSRFRYLLLIWCIAPNNGDTLLVSPSYMHGCSRTYWTAQDGADPDFPTYPGITSITPLYADDPSGRAYHSENPLDLPPGDYEVFVDQLQPLTGGSRRTACGAYHSSSRSQGRFVLNVPPEAAAGGPQVAVLRSGTQEYRFPLAGYEVRYPEINITR